MRKASLRFILVTLALALVIQAALFLMPQARAAHAASISPLHISGNRLIDTSGTQVILRGFNRSGTEYACVQGWGIFDGPSDAASVAAIASWGSNSVNVLLNEDCWLGINGVNPAYGGTNYQNAIVAYTQLLEQAGIYPTLSYTWAAPGTTLALDQPSMPDADHATAFWTSVANTFKNDNRVLLRLQEEPHPAGNTNTTAAWQCWANGGASCNEGFSTVGFKSLMSTVRATGSTNVVQVPGLAYASDVTQFLTYMPVDNNMMGVVDVYGNNGCGSPTCFDSEYAPVAAAMPFMAGEFGETYDDSVCGTTAIDAIMGWFDAHASGYNAWVWDTWGTACGNLSLILDYNGTPKSPNGVGYKNHLASLVGQPTPTPTSTNTPTPTFTPTPTPIGDTIPPTASITSPPNGSIVTRNTTVTIAASASDDIGVTRVRFYVNNTLKCIVTTAPYTCAWAVPMRRNRTYTLRVNAYDAAGNKGTATITVHSSS